MDRSAGGDRGCGLHPRDRVLPDRPMKPEPKPLTVRRLRALLRHLPEDQQELPVYADGCDCEDAALDVIVRPGHSVLVARYVAAKPKTPEEIESSNAAKQKELAKAQRRVERAYAKHLAAMTPRERKMAEVSALGVPYSKAMRKRPPKKARATR